MIDGDNMENGKDSVSELVKSSIEQAQKSHRTYVEMCEKIRPAAVDESEIEINENALDLAKFDTDESFKLALLLVDVTDAQEAVTLYQEHASAQNEEMAKRVAKLQMLVNGAPEPTAAEMEIIAEPVVAETPTEDQSAIPVAQAAVSSAALAGVAAAAAIVADDTPRDEQLDTAASDLVDIIAPSDEPVSEESMEAEIQALTTKIHDVENVESDTIEVREFDSENVELVSEGPELEDVPELEAPVVEDVPEIELAAPAVVEVAEIAVATPVVEEVAELEVAAPVVDEVAELEVAAPVVEEVAEIELAAPAVVEVAEIAVATPVVEEVAEIEVAASVAEAAVAVPVEPAIDPQSFDTDLSARLDAVRAMLQGSPQ